MYKLAESKNLRGLSQGHPRISGNGFFIFFFLAAVSTRAWESNYTLHTVRIKTVGYRTSTNRIVIRVKLSIDRTVRRVAILSTSRFISVGLHTLDQHFRFEVYSQEGLMLFSACPGSH